MNDFSSVGDTLAELEAMKSEQPTHLYDILERSAELQAQNSVSPQQARELAETYFSRATQVEYQTHWFKSDNLIGFFHDRLKVHLKDDGIRHDVIDACLAMPNSDDLTLLVNRARALSAFLKSDDGTNLLQGFKRANNILTQAEEQDGVEYSFGPDPKLAADPTEAALFKALDQAETKITPAMANEDFETAMQAMASLRAPIDAFFDAVQINADNSILRRNRLNVLHRIRTICLSVADLTKIEG